MDYHGVPVDGAGCGAPSPLVRAMRRGHVETVRWLLQAGARAPGMGMWIGGGGMHNQSTQAAGMEALLVEYRGRARK